MKKKTIANLIMVAVIALIAAAGILGVGHIKGWFDTIDETQAIIEDARGITTLLRDGVSYPAENKTVLRAGDQLTCQSGATTVIKVHNGQLILGEKASLTVTDPAADAFSANIHSGEIFAHCDDEVLFSFDGKDISIAQATALLSIRSGAQSVSVLRGSVDDANAGQVLQLIGAEKSVGTLALESLNAFAITQIRALNSASLCFTTDDLDRLAAQRHAALQELINSHTQPTDPASTTESTDPQQNTSQTVPSTQPTPEVTLPKDTTPTETTEPFEDTKPQQATTPTTLPSPPATSSCTIAIYCDTILDNMSDLEAGKAEFVSSDGVILSPVTVNFSDGETVFDVLKRICDLAGIQIEYSWTPLYNSYYVEGINNLYEFDCGFESGWMYKVNGWFPNYGCSSYTLKDGDVIVWCYTCKGLGTDVGAPRME